MTKLRFLNFGPFRIDIAQRLLLNCDDKPIALTPKAFDLLLLLVENNGQIVEKERLLEEIWPDSFVEEGSISRNIFVLRRVLNEADSNHNYIETIPKRGYRFISNVDSSRSEKTNTFVDKQNRVEEALKVIAVLPFKQFSADIGNEYLAIGLTDMLITRLSNIRKIMVRPTSTILKYTHTKQALKEIAEELKVDFIVEGTIRIINDRVRVTVQLVSIKSGSPLWADKFDEKFTDIFSIEDSISEKVAESLALNLTKAEKSLLNKYSTQNTEAYKLYLKGNYFFHKRTKEYTEQGINCFNQAIDLEPSYALAYTRIAYSYIMLSWMRASSPKDALPKARTAAIKALEIDETLADAHTSLAFVDAHYWNWREAEQSFLRAIELNQNCVYAHLWYSLFLAANERFDEALIQAEQIQILDPLSIPGSNCLGMLHHFARDYDSAISYYLKVLELDKTFFPALIGIGRSYLQKGDYLQAVNYLQKAYQVNKTTWSISNLAQAYELMGKKEDSKQLFKELNTLSENCYISPYDIAETKLVLGEIDQALDWMEKAYEDQSVWLLYTKVSPELDCLRSQTRFNDLLARIGFTY